MVRPSQRENEARRRSGSLKPLQIRMFREIPVSASDRE
jgi:hypothetical protein